jgi:hypothetical protein
MFAVCPSVLSETTVFKLRNLIFEGYLEVLDIVHSNENYDGHTEDLIKFAKKISAEFVSKFSDILCVESNIQLIRIGNDLYFSTHGHGVGFWEEEYKNSHIYQKWVDGSRYKYLEEYVTDDGKLDMTF